MQNKEDLTKQFYWINLENVSEAPGENIFLVKNNKLITPSLNSSALDGITRRSIITLANDMKLKIKIKKGQQRRIKAS